MKTKYDFQKPLVQGTPDDITKDELRVITFEDGKIDILKRDSKAAWVSICKGGNSANPEIDVTSYDDSGKFKESVELLISYLTSDPLKWHTIAKTMATYNDAVETIKSYMPQSKEDAKTLSPNVIGWAGYNTDDGGVICTNADTMLWVKNSAAGTDWVICQVPTANIPITPAS